MIGFYIATYHYLRAVAQTALLSIWGSLQMVCRGGQSWYFWVVVLEFSLANDKAAKLFTCDSLFKLG